MELSRPPFAVTASPTSQCIMGCKSAVQLGALVMEHGGTFDHTASAAAMWKLQTIVNGPIDQSGRSSEVEALEQLLQLMLTHLKSMGSRHVTTILQSLARLAYWDEAVLDSILQHSARILASFSPPCLVGTIWSLATLGHQSAAGFVTSLLLKARSRIKEFTPLNLGLMLWSMAVLDIEESRCIREFLYHALKLSQGPNLEMQIHQQLLSTMSWIKDRQVDLTEKYQAIVADIIQTSSSALAVSPQSVPTVSRVQEDVLSVVRSLPGCQAKGNVELEHLTADGLHSIDIALMLPSRTHIAIEVDGPMHFLACKDPSTGRLVLNGRTKLRNRLLEARGWRVLSVPVQEWCGIVTERERRAYLEDRLRKLGGLGGDEPKGRAGGAATCLAPQSSTKDQRKGKVGVHLLLLIMEMLTLHLKCITLITTIFP